MSAQLPRQVLPMIVIDEESRASAARLRGRTRLTKLVFLSQQLRPSLVNQLLGTKEAYHFEPYHYGPYSKDLIDDIDSLDAEGYLKTTLETLDSRGKVVQHAYELTPEGSRFLTSWPTDPETDRQLRSFLDRFIPMARSQLVTFVHEHFPAYLKVD